MTKVEIIDTQELPKCPYCGKDLDKIEKSSKGFIEQHIVYRCPYCKKLLGIGNIDLY